jgi:aminopeptidase
MKKTALKKYARLIARMGANVQKGQEVVITTGLDQPEFVKLLAEECYRAGAKKVRVEWSYDPLSKVHARWMKQRDLEKVEDWEKAKLQHMVDTLPVRILLESSDPDGLTGIHPRYFKALQKRALIVKPYRDAMDNRHQWCIAAVPGPEWAKKLYPALTVRQAMEQLWKDILFTSRADGDDPVAAWEEHNRDLKARSEYLNSLGLRRLHYTSSNGTDLTVGLMPRGRFQAGADATLQGVVFDPNIPTEEVFTSPDRRTAEGVVYATKPLSYQGQLIEDFFVRFENGRVTEVKAQKGQAVLEHIINMDEGSRYLGECALVPKESPINVSGILFYNTLFDENAACHLALGAGFNECVDGFASLSQDELFELGVNDSVTHVDFMIGSDDLAIDGFTADGKTVPIFRNGTWAF